jgi:hypothetical protein
MFPWSLIGTALKTGSEIYKNRSATKIAMSEAQLIHAEKMKRGEIEYSGKIYEVCKKIRRQKNEQEEIIL